MGNTEAITVSITNTGEETIENWMLSYDDFCGNIDAPWNATVVEVDESESYLRNVGYNANIQPDESISFGYHLEDANSIPQEITLCQERVAKCSEDFSASLNITGEWGSIFNAEIILHNNMDKPLEWWELTFDSNFTITEITSSWAADKFDLGNTNYMFKGTYTGIVPPQSTILLGFSGVKNDDLDDPDITIQSLTEVVFGGFPNEIDEEIARQEELEYIESLNENSEYPLEIAYNDDGTAYSIDGKFSEVCVTDAVSASNALNDVKYLLGITDVSSQLSFENEINNDATDFSIYTFKQVYNNLPLLDRYVSVIARDNGETFSISSNFYTPHFSINTRPSITQNILEEEYLSNNIYLCIYTLNEYAESPILAYYIETGAEVAIVSAENGSVVDRFSNVYYESKNDEEDSFVDIDIYSVTDLNSIYKHTDENGKLIYGRGSIGAVNINVDKAPELVFSAEELNELGIDSSDIELEYMTSSKTLVTQNVDLDKYQEYVNNHQVILINENDTYYTVNTPVKEYYFIQKYKDIQVYGRMITETVNDFGQTIIFDSNILNDEQLKSAFSGVEIKENASIESVKLANMQLNSFEAELDEPVLYTWNEFQDSPVLVFVFLDRISDRTYLVSAEKDNYGQILNLDNNSYHLGKGLGECDETHERTLQYFPIETDGTLGFSHTFSDSTANVVVKIPSRKYTDNTKDDETVIKSETTYFCEPEAVSAYLNFLNSYDFFATNYNHYLNENNINHRDSTLNLYIKQQYYPGAIAYALGASLNFPIRGLGVYSNGSKYPCTVTHEYTHTIFSSYNISTGYNTVTRGLNEGYAYLLGYNTFSNWETVKKASYQKEPTYDVDFNDSKTDYLYDKKILTKECHDLSTYLIYPATLMHNNQMSYHDIGVLYYHSMFMGKYTASSTLNTFRLNVIKAAKALHYDESKLAIVKAALDELWKHDNRLYRFTLNIEEFDESDIDIQNVTVVLKKNLEESAIEPIDSENLVYTIEPGTIYYLEVSAPGYITYRNIIHMYYMENNSHTVQLVKINRDASGEIINGNKYIKATDCITNQPVGAIVKLRKYDESYNLVFVTDDSGEPISYLADTITGFTNVISLQPGYYYPYVSEADNYFVKPMMTIGSDDSIPDESSAYIYYDSNLDGSKQSRFNYIRINEYYEDGYNINTDFNAFDTLTVITEQDTYVGRSGPTQFGREMYLLYYEPTSEASFNLAFKPNQSQLEKLENILRAEGNLCIDPTTEELTLGHIENGEVVAQPSSKSYYNIEISNNNFGITSPTIITAWDLYYGLTHNNGVYTLKLISYDGNGNLET